MQWAVEFNIISVVIGLWRCVVGLPWVCVSSVKDVLFRASHASLKGLWWLLLYLGSYIVRGYLRSFVTANGINR